ncbi:MAG: tetratricopeptide repeat protein [Deltaproteobacteria bacterium]|nr:tetratricopeptide repeat protein [Deltaproteobacteria bacterium]
MIFLPLFLLLTSPDSARAQIKLANGQLAYNSGDCVKAQKMFRDAIRLDSTLSSAHYFSGLCFYRSGKFKKAETELLEAYDDYSSNPEYLKTLGSVAIALRKYNWAMNHLKQAYSISSDDPQTAWLLALSLYHLGDCKNALEILENGKKRKKNEKNIVLLKSMCLVKMKKLVDARNLLWKSRNLGSSVESFLDRIFVKELNLSRTMGGSWKINQGFDSNPSYDPDIQPSEDSGFFTLARGNLWLNTRYFQSGALLERTWYWSNSGIDEHKKLNSFSSWRLASDAGLIYRYLENEQHRAVSGGYFFSLLSLDGGAGIPLEPDPFIYAETHGLYFRYSHYFSKDYSVEYSVLPSWRTMRDIDRTGGGVKFSASGSIFFNRGKLKWFPVVMASFSDARWNAWKYWSVSTWHGVSAVLGAKIDAAIWAGVEGRYFPDSSEEMLKNANPWNLGYDTDRLDIISTAGFSLSRVINTTWKPRLEISVTHSYNWSESPLFTYSRTAVFIGVSGDFSIIR